MKIAVVSRKGGVGKTTTTMYFAQALTELGTVEVLDADPQGSATDWALTAEDAGNPLPFPVNAVNARTIGRSNPDVDYTLIDTPPGFPDIIQSAIDVADAVVIPTGSSSMDMALTWRTLDIVGGTPAILLLTRSNPRTRAHQAAEETIRSEGAALFPAAIPQREAIKNSFGGPITNLYGYDATIRELIEAVEQLAQLDPDITQEQA